MTTHWGKSSRISIRNADGSFSELPEVVDISSCLDIPGWMNEWELKWLAETALKSRFIIEIGSWCGRSTRALALHTPGRVFAVDPWVAMTDPESGMVVTQSEADDAYEIFRDQLKDLIAERRVVVIRDGSMDAVRRLILRPDVQYYDMVFIDGSHTYEAVSNEILAYKPLLRLGGILSGHDNWMPGVKKAIDELVPGYTCPAGGIWCKEV